jgi:DEAD/DEAH box helicase domain-containing protein
LETDFNPPSKKRKLPASDAAKPKTTKSKGKGKGKGKAKSSDFVANVPWPEHFKELEKVFKVHEHAVAVAHRMHRLTYEQALNTVYTFFNARKHVAPTFENLQKSIEGLLKRFE